MSVPANYAGPLTGPIAEGTRQLRRRDFFPRTYSKLIDRRIRPDALRHAVVSEREMRHQFYKQGSILSSDMRQTVAPPWSQRMRPTHFIALRVPPHSALYHGISALRGDVAASFTLRKWERCFVPLEKLHLTVAVFTCPDDAVTARARKVAEDFFTGSMLVKGSYSAHVAATRGSLFHDKNVDVSRPGRIFVSDRASAPTNPRNPIFAQYTSKGCFAPLSIRFNGLGTFQDGRVVFARVAADHDFQRLNDAMRKLRCALADAGADVKGNPNDDFTPHVTVAKITKKAQEVLQAEAAAAKKAENPTGTAETAVVRSLIHTSLPPRKAAALSAVEGAGTASSSEGLLQMHNVSPLYTPAESFFKVPTSVYGHVMFDDFGLATFTQGGMFTMQWASMAGNWALQEVPLERDATATDSSSPEPSSSSVADDGSVAPFDVTKPPGN